ncbi:uncharacterized protein A4U43_C07F32890 [Asparagus officinalis]|uniref:Galactose-1-phosphate uridyl transferase N-terminal domain-containing protein n=1 Tax=Asparagus officinalis TaxID=4686 RepID=A0A5P1EGZ4_ASPOF|nr:ADP-glucose phosphorylase isoform X1 [Asparagus officinalis]ONK65043.1 uncharacterized protein A4U43_C07F32890 [Asparagus officinalis]
MSSSSSRSPELRRDSIFNRWVIFSPARSRRPSDFKSHSNPNPKNPNPSSCPFCIGHESECAPEIFRFPKGSSNWKVRVIENLYPALKRDEGIISDPERLDPKGCVVAGFGFHDVVIESTTHSVHLPDLSEAEVGEVVRAYKERILQLKRVGSVKYVQVFKNHGASAGASLTHSHSQMIGLPIVPPSVSSRLKSMKEYYDRTGKCGLCEALSKDILINKSTHFFSIVPFAATYPFEIWIVPRDHTSYFHDIDEEKVVDFGGLLKLMLLKMSSQLNDPPYNFMIHTAPFELPSDHLPCAHWFLQIVPQLGVTGGFEMGSGCYINPVFPEDAANILREVDCSQR